LQNHATCDNSRFSYNEVNDGENETEVNMHKHDLGQLKEGVSHEDYVSYDNDIITCQVQTL